MAGSCSENYLRMKINVDSIIKNAGLELLEVARVLFPAHDHPDRALNRIIKGDGLLDELQVFQLATLIGCEVSELYSGDGWKASFGSDNQHIFRSDTWTAYYNANTGVTQLYGAHGGYRELVMSPSNTTITDYLQTLTELVTHNQ